MSLVQNIGMMSKDVQVVRTKQKLQQADTDSAAVRENVEIKDLRERGNLEAVTGRPIKNIANQCKNIQLSQ